jgi:hypothetical protein
MVDVCYVYIQNFSFDFFMVFWMMFSDFGVPGVHRSTRYAPLDRQSLRLKNIEEAG